MLLCCLWPFPLQSPAISLFPSSSPLPVFTCLTITGTRSLWSKVKYIIDFLNLCCLSLSRRLSTSSHLSSFTSSSCLWGELLSTSPTSSGYDCLTSSLHAWIHLRVSPRLLNSQTTHLNHARATNAFWFFSFFPCAAQSFLSWPLKGKCQRWENKT